MVALHYTCVPSVSWRIERLKGDTGAEGVCSMTNGLPYRVLYGEIPYPQTAAGAPRLERKPSGQSMTLSDR